MSWKPHGKTGSGIDSFNLFVRLRKDDDDRWHYNVELNRGDQEPVRHTIKGDVHAFSSDTELDRLRARSHVIDVVVEALRSRM